MISSDIHASAIVKSWMMFVPIGDGQSMFIGFYLPMMFGVHSSSPMSWDKMTINIHKPYTSNTVFMPMAHMDTYRGFHKCGIPKNGWFIMKNHENPKF